MYRKEFDTCSNFQNNVHVREFLQWSKMHPKMSWLLWRLESGPGAEHQLRAGCLCHSEAEETKTSSSGPHEHSDIPGRPSGGHDALKSSQKNPLSSRRSLWASDKVKPDKPRCKSCNFDINRNGISRLKDNVHFFRDFYT